jgi:hypothetical protein
MRQTLSDNTDPDTAYAFGGLACIKVLDFGRCEFELVMGSYHVYKQQN